MQGLLGIKRGMTQVYDEDGRRIAVTVLEAGPCVVTQVKNTETDGYTAVQVAFSEQKAHRLTKPRLGHLKKAGVEPHRVLKEFGVDEGDSPEPGTAYDVSIFENAGYVDITGVTKGRGFAGVVKRHRMAGGRMTHGGHSRRRVGSIGQCSYPARVAKGQRMPGHMGNRTRTCQNLRIVRLDSERNLVLVHGAVPGPNGSLVVIKKALKKTGESK